jgi:NAD(P)-dependent dehydrogenase (short-subunit alcohol dehydrogenase family)
MVLDRFGRLDIPVNNAAVFTSKPFTDCTAVSGVNLAGFFWLTQRADLVVSTTSFDHWTDQAAGIRECARALAPGATLVLTDQFSNLLWPTMLGSRRGKARTRSRATRLITAAGLREPRWHPCYAVIIQSVTAVK